MIGPEFHVRRALQQVRHEASTSVGPEEENLDNKLLEVVDTPTSRIEHGFELLFSGFAVGGVAGFVIGSIYAFRTKQVNPVKLGLGSGISLGLLGAQYAGFRYLLPEGIQRQYSRLVNDENDQELFGSSFSDLARAPGLGLPDFLLDLNIREQKIIGSGLAGGLAGYITTAAKAFETATAHRLNTASVGSRGFRGALFWSIFFAFGEWLWQRFEDYKDDKLAESAIKNMYADGEEEKLSALIHGQQVPEKARLLPPTFTELVLDPKFLIEYYELDLSWLPFIHNDKDCEYREYLESKHRLLEEEVDLLKRLERKRLKRIEKLRLTGDNNE